MSQLDAFIGKLQAGQELLLETKKEPSIRSAAGLTVVVNKQLLSPQIVTLLIELAPADKKEDLKAGHNATFDYLVNSRPYSVNFMQHGEMVRAVISLKEDSPAASAAPAAHIAPHAPAAPPPKPAPQHQVVIPAALAEKKFQGEPIINRLFHKMVEMGSSDLHLISGHKPHVRESGDMVEIPGEEVITLEKMKEMMYQIMPQQNILQFEATCDTDLPHEIPGLARFRVNVFTDRYGIGSVSRVIPVEIVTAEKLGLSKEVLDLCFLSKGLVLVTGPTGSGKSTTLCALIDYVNRHRKDHIITIEDPIEFVHPNKLCLINQREVHVHTKSFSTALRAALREDPDIILVGEMRDLETVSIALETAETGHLVFGTLHTSTAASTVDRIVDQFPADRQQQIRTMLASSLKGVISQTLCKKMPKGRVAAQEILLVNPAVSNLIREAKTYQIPSIIQSSRAIGMVMMNDALMDLVTSRQVSPEEAYIKSVDKAALLAVYTQKGIKLKLQGV